MYKIRIKNTAKLLSEYDIDALLIEDPVNIRYLTGLDVSSGSLIIGSKCVLFLDGRYFEALKSKSPIEIKPLESLIEGLSKCGKRIGFDQEKTSYSRFLTLQKASKHLIPVENIIKK